MWVARECIYFDDLLKSHQPITNSADSALSQKPKLTRNRTAALIFLKLKGLCVVKFTKNHNFPFNNLSSVFSATHQVDMLVPNGIEEVTV